MSNRYNLKHYIAISAFNAESNHNLTIEINKKNIFTKDLIKDKEYHLKISDYFDYKKPGLNNIEIRWAGEHECEKKYLKIFSIVIHDQHIAPHSVMITPVRNEYIQNLLSTEEGTTFYNEKIFYPGHRHGWYGSYKFKFLLDPKEIKNSEQQSLIAMTGIKLDSIITDAEKIIYQRRAYKK
jgi:hypothetical protein